MGDLSALLDRPWVASAEWTVERRGDPDWLPDAVTETRAEERRVLRIRVREEYRGSDGRTGPASARCGDCSGQDYRPVEDERNGERETPGGAPYTAGSGAAARETVWETGPGRYRKPLGWD